MQTVKLIINATGSFYAIIQWAVWKLKSAVRVIIFCMVMKLYDNCICALIDIIRSTKISEEHISLIMLPQGCVIPSLVRSENEISAVQWRHNERDGVSNIQRIQCLLNCWFIKENIKAPRYWPLWGIHWWPVNSPLRRPVTRKMFPFDDVIMGYIISASSVTNIHLLVKSINTLRPRRNRRHCADDIFECTFVIENVLILITISLKFIPTGLINNIRALVWIMTRVGN